ncbi:helix-turn-helix domain-containing protein [Paenibacillus polysaccharolyticus]|uniref:helix-turn-helix domain-containing protein n=1 Tax=Paenibacillus polysaccharolyticus TaxID=582692 RepID=UPI00203BD0EB|nr:helix-turn-helix domain-containing protein [Paenibacillus polysaccharolyticus]MCM3134596.1 helix-turn-helix domain-containing protein [Paenibacillus polysaccharolyticus]
MTNNPSKDQLQQNMDNIMSQLMQTEEASELWGLSQGYIKNLCANGDVIAEKIGRSWLLLRDQPNPKQG